MKSIGETKLTEILPFLRCVALQYGLKLSRVEEFKLAKNLLVNLYLQNQ